MTKIEFLENLRNGLSVLPQVEIEDRLSFYGEMIDDRIEDGVSEEDAVADVGNIDEITMQIISEIPLAKIVKEKLIPKNKLKAWEIVLLILGSPIWLSLLIAMFAVIFSLYVTLWSLIVSLWAVFASVIGSSVGAMIAGVVYMCTGNVFSGIAIVGAGLVLAGLSVFLYFGCIAATKGTLLLTKKIIFGIKNCFIKRGKSDE